MTTTALIQLFKDTLRGILLSDQDQESASDAIICGELNNAQVQFAEWTQFTVPRIGISIGGSSYDYNVNDLNATNRPRIVEKLLNASSGVVLKVKTYKELLQDHPTWMTDTTTGDVTDVYQHGYTLIFYPVPASLNSTDYFLIGECDPVELSSSLLTDEPQLDRTLHRHIAKYAAALVSRTNRLNDQQIDTVARIEQEAKEACLDVYRKETANFF